MRDDGWKLYDEMTQFCRDGVRLYLGDSESSPGEIMDACTPDGGYMRDYVTDQKGELSEIRFYRID